MEHDNRPSTLEVPAITALKEQAAFEGPPRGRMERSISEDIREEREDLKQAAEHSLNVILDLSLNGIIRWVSPSWKDVIGTDVESVKGQPIADILVGNNTVFADAVETMQKDDSRSQIIRFTVKMGPSSVLKPKDAKEEATQGANSAEEPATANTEETLDLEAQGIMVYDRTSGGESHTMWMIRPSVVREVTIDLPDVLVESLGVGAEVLARYLTALAEVGASDPANHPPPLPVLCRICERQITPWWFEKHTDLCLQEHKAEMDVSLAQESLMDHRNAIVKVLDALEVQSRQPRVPPAEPPAPCPVPEYKGLPIGPQSTPSSGPSSGRVSPASPPSRSRDQSASGFSHHRARSFAVRRPVSRIVELVLDLCDTAIEINTPAIKETRGQPVTEFRTQSPQSESRISQVLQWQSPSTSTLEQEQGLLLLCDDTAKLARTKVDAVLRHRRIIEYSERIRIEFDVLVQECIDAAMRKAARIAAGELSDSSDEMADQLEDEDDTREEIETFASDQIPKNSLVGPSAMATALRNASDPALDSHSSRRPSPPRRASSAAVSTGSSSPRGSQTPRSYGGAMSFVSNSKGNSTQMDSDIGAESDSSMLSFVMSGSQRAESPSSDVGLARVTSSRDRKRKSLVLPSMSSRQQSPARTMGPPSSPLRIAKARVPSGSESVQSPITSPVLSTGDFSSPAIAAQNLHHRRQSSATSLDVLRNQLSPRLVPVSSNPQPRAVPPSIKDFEIVKPISKGAFGSVYLSKKKSTGDYFAIKVLKKADMVAKNQVTNVKAERAIMMWQGESDFVAKLYWTFASKDYLYLVMEYLNGGDVASLIKVLCGLPEDWAKKYLAEMVLCVDHLHSRGIVHRDLKPDNLLIDHRGHLKLTDFGLSRMGLIGRQKHALNSKSEEPVPDLLKQGPFHRAVSLTSSRSASFDYQGNHSPSQTPGLTPAISNDIGPPSYFTLSRETSTSREPSRRTSGHRSDSENSEALQGMLRRFSLADETLAYRRSPIEEETGSEEGSSPDPYLLQPTISHASTTYGGTPPPVSAMLPPPLALFDPEDSNRRFVGTPDYLAPETIKGLGQDEVSDWWSLGCILFECLYGYPPFHADSPDEVFQNILARKIDWPDDDICPVSAEAKDLMNRLMCTDPLRRLGANTEGKFSSGGEEIKNHPWFADVNWDTLREDEASFVPAPQDPEDTEYFDSRGATLQSFAPEFEDQDSSQAGTPGADYPDRPHDALSRVRSQVNSIKRGLMPLHIPPHVRDGRSRRLSEPVIADDFGNFTFKNLPVLEKANKDVIQKLRAEAMQAQSKSISAVTSPAICSSVPSLESSPILPAPLKRTMSTNKGGNRPASPSLLSQASASPNRASQPSSPLLVSFSTGQSHERRKVSSSLATLSHQTSNTLQPGALFDAPRLPTNIKAASSASSPIKIAKSPGMPLISHERTISTSRRRASVSQSEVVTSPRARSHTVSSNETDTIAERIPHHYKRRSQAFDISPSSSDNEEQRQKALLRVQRRRQSSRRLSRITLADGPIFRPLDVLVCEDHPVSRLVMEKLLEKLRCRTIVAQNGTEALSYAMSEVKFDIIMMEFKLPQVNGADVARMIRDTHNSNRNTPIVAVTGYLKDLQAPHHFDALIEKPPTTAKLTEVMSRLCQWSPPPPNWTPGQFPMIPPPSALRRESSRTEDSPISNASSFPAMTSSSYRESSREDSISSSFFGDTDSRGDDIPVIISRQATDDWRDRDLSRAFGGLGISDMSMAEVEAKPMFQQLAPQQASAPAALEHPQPLKTWSGDIAGPKRRSLEKKLEFADSGDDECDNEPVGGLQVRPRSPKGGRPRGSSKLGTEMLRTNSHGSVVSVEDSSVGDLLVASPPPLIPEDPVAEEQVSKKDHADKHISMTPPEIFPPIPGHTVKEIDMDAETDVDATPRPSHINTSDPDPTPRGSASPLH